MTRDAFARRVNQDPRGIRYLLNGQREIRRWHWDKWSEVLDLPPYNAVDDRGFDYEEDSWLRDPDEQLGELGQLRRNWPAASALRTLRYTLQHSMCVDHDNALATSVGTAFEGLTIVAQTARANQAQRGATWWLQTLDGLSARLEDL